MKTVIEDLITCLRSGHSLKGAFADRSCNQKRMEDWWSMRSTYEVINSDNGSKVLFDIRVPKHKAIAKLFWFDAGKQHESDNIFTNPCVCVGKWMFAGKWTVKIG